MNRSIRDKPDDPTNLESWSALQEANQSITRLKAALRHARMVGIATGMIAERHRISPQDGTGMLLAISNRTGRTVFEVAHEMVRTGYVPRQPP
ncbi:ANTAR domain-containing protein [Pseudonocardiaceae bacterium YIM PH 21723]|nr:ANTAR domain-containing protein [Pseudonocardiaceae bacterium YIM PH 21723]